MKFAVSKGEKDISELATRLYDIKGRGAADASKKAEAALLKANPHISDLSKIREGTLIVIPDSAADAPPVKDAQTASAAADFDEPLKLSVKELGVAFTRSAEAEAAAIAAANEWLKSREVKEFAAQSPEAREQMEKLHEELSRQAKEAKAAAAQKEALAQLQEALRKFNL